MRRLTVMTIGVLLALAGCGQRGALYMPDRNARVVTRSGSAPASAPSSAPSAPPSAAPAAEAR